MKSKLLRYSIQCSIAIIAYYFLSNLIGLRSGIINFIVDLGTLFLFHFLYFKKEGRKMKPLFRMTGMVALIYLGFKLFEFNFFDPGTLEEMYLGFRSQYELYGRSKAEVNQGMDLIKGMLNRTTWPIFTSLGVFINGMIAIFAVFIATKLGKNE